MSDETNSAIGGDPPPDVKGVGAAPATFKQAAEALAVTAEQPAQEETLAAWAKAVGERAVVFHHEAGVHAVAHPVLPAQPVPVEYHVCAGLNGCAKHDLYGTALIAGAGECATSQHVCHGVGACRGQGGCGYSGTAYEQAIPAEQSCSHHGSCASPINECRVSSMGSNKGKSVWKLARKLFETRMFNSTVQFQDAPREGSSDYEVPAYVTSVPGVVKAEDLASAQGSLCRQPHPDQLAHDLDADDNLCRATEPAKRHWLG